MEYWFCTAKKLNVCDMWPSYFSSVFFQARDVADFALQPII